MAFAISRYSRQELLPHIGKKGQRQLSKSSAVVVGMGALGTVSAEILARAGIGKLVLVDRDVVELTDLQRQLLYGEGDIGKPKSVAAAGKLCSINSEIRVAAAVADLDYKSVSKLVAMPDVVLDCTDSLETRFLLNEYCLKNRIAWVHAAAIRNEAQLMAFDFRKRAEKSPQPCFACVFGNSSAVETCDTVGVLASATAAIAAMQATEAIKLLVGAKTETRLTRLNVWNNTLVKVAVRRNSGCGSCKKGGSHDYLNGKKGAEAVSLCGRNSYQIKGKSVDLQKLKRQMQRMGEKVSEFGECISFGNITLFGDGRALVKADSASKAKADYRRYVGL